MTVAIDSTKIPRWTPPPAISTALLMTWLDTQEIMPLRPMLPKGWGVHPTDDHVDRRPSHFHKLEFPTNDGNAVLLLWLNQCENLFASQCTLANKKKCGWHPSTSQAWLTYGIATKSASMVSLDGKSVILTVVDCF